MIEINLKPGREKQKTRVSFLCGGAEGIFLRWAGIAAAAMFLISIFFMVYPKISEYRLNRLKTRWRALRGTYEEAVRLKKEKDRLYKNLQDIRHIINKRILWAEKMNNISDSLPSEIQLTYIGFTGEKGKNAEERKVLIMSGLVPAYPGEVAIQKFIKKLRSNKNFSEDFPVITPPSTKMGGNNIKEFTLKCYTRGKDGEDK